MELSSSRVPASEETDGTARRVDGDVVDAVVADLGEVALHAVGVLADHAGDGHGDVADAGPVLRLAALGLGEVHVDHDGVPREGQPLRRREAEAGVDEIRAGAGGGHGTHSLLTRLKPVAHGAPIL